MQITTKLKIQRTLHNLSQKELGKKIDVSSTYIHLLENMKTRPSTDKSELLEEIFNVKIDQLLSVVKVGDKH